MFALFLLASVASGSRCLQNEKFILDIAFRIWGEDPKNGEKIPGQGFIPYQPDGTLRRLQDMTMKDTIFPRGVVGANPLTIVIAPNLRGSPTNQLCRNDFVWTLNTKTIINENWTEWTWQKFLTHRFGNIVIKGNTLLSRETHCYAT